MRVLIATDGEEPSSLAERFVVDVADRTRVETLAACINTFEMSLHQSEVAGLDHYSPEAGASYARMIAQATGDRLAAAGFVAKPLSDDGDAAFALLGILAEERCDLAVMGAARSRLGNQPLVGRICRYLLLEAPCSVVLVHAWPTPKGRPKVLVATDGSAGAEDAVRAFAMFADPAACDVLVTSVVHPLIGASLIGSSPIDIGPRKDPSREEEAADAAARAAVLLRDRGFSCRIQPVRGLPAAAILDLAERDGSSLVVVGSRGLGRFERMALGSVSDAVARHSPAAFVGRNVRGVDGA